MEAPDSPGMTGSVAQAVQGLDSRADSHLPSSCQSLDGKGPGWVPSSSQKLSSPSGIQHLLRKGPECKGLRGLLTDHTSC